MASANLTARDYITIIMFIVGLFGGRKRKKVALRLFPLASSAMTQWNNGVADKLARYARDDQQLATFKATVDEGVAILKQGL